MMKGAPFLSGTVILLRAMENLKLFLEKFKAGTATKVEKEQLLADLSLNEEQLKELLKVDFDNDVETQIKSLSSEKSIEIYRQIQLNKSTPVEEAVEQNTKVFHLSKAILKWSAAACIGITFIGIWYANKQTDSRLQPHTAKTTQKPDTIFNKTNTVVKKVLEDRSEISLEPNSTMIYLYDLVKRDIRLTGKATFKVMKDKTKPFTVYANGIGTTAVGTLFSVDALNNKIVVKLFEGKVLVRSIRSDVKMDSTYLLPGEQLNMDIQNSRYAVNTFELASDDKPKKRTVSPTQKNIKDATVLSFSKSPLNEVFDKISDKYNVTIRYNLKDIKTLSFTGSFLPTDPLKTMLTLICNTNDLSFQEKSGIFLITR